MELIRKSFIIFLICIFFIFILNLEMAYSQSSLRKWALPLLGVSLIAGYGAIHFQKKANEKYDESETLYQEYLAIPEGQPNEVFEQKYETYENRFADAESLRTYYLLCLGGSALTFIGSIVLWFYNPSSSKLVDFGYNNDFTTGQNDLYIKVKF